MDTDNWMKFAAVCVALSGWFKVLYDHYIAKPKIGGQILGVMTGVIEVPDRPPMTSFMVYPYLVNSSKSGVHILDYELYTQCNGEGWVRHKRVYGGFPVAKFTSSNGGDIVIENLEGNTIFKKAGLAQYGVPLHGWAPFVGDIDFYSKSVEKYKLVCIDAYGSRHEILYGGKSEHNLLLLLELGELKLPSDMYES